MLMLQLERRRSQPSMFQGKMFCLAGTLDESGGKRGNVKDLLQIDIAKGFGSASPGEIQDPDHFFTGSQRD